MRERFAFSYATEVLLAVEENIETKMAVSKKSRKQKQQVSRLIKYLILRILIEFCFPEVDNDFDTPQLMEEGMFNGDNGASENTCNGNGGRSEVKF